jgi:flagellar L-ring protein precursor FlgH
VKTSKLTLAATLVALLAPVSYSQDRVGSIYRPNGGPMGSIANKTARRPGDLITVLISENQDVSNQETSDIKRETSLDYALLNFDIKDNAFNPLPAIQGEGEDELKGTANYKKKGEFTARVTAIVVDVLPNGNLVLNGRREIRIDQETKVLEITGVVRRYDVKPDNTVQSELVADARVSYAGEGPLTDATNRRGIGKAIFDFIRWITPF